MSKNIDRYKADLSHLDIETLDELETQKFERFHPKKQKPVKGYQGKKKQKPEELD
jgi:hypothetical protein